MGIFNVAVSGLNAAQVGILTTSHNIANASTAGYNRQQIIQTSNTPMFTGAGFLGQGTSVETIRRVYNQQLNEQVQSARTGVAEMDSYLSQIAQIDNLLADPSAGLSPAMSGFFKAVQEMAANPASLPARQAMLSASQSLVARFQAIDERMTEIRSGVNAQITSEVGAINSYAQQIAEINQRIVLAQAAGPHQPANDLLDRRDQLIAELNTKIRATTISQSDGTYSVFIGNGQPLVVGTLPYSMQAVAAPDDPERMIVALRSPTGSTVLMPDSMLKGGALGGLLAFRNESLDAAQNALGRIALTLATNINDQHRLGQDLTGALGGDYFDMSQMGPMVRPNANNTGSGVLAVTVSSIGNLTTSDYRLNYDGTNYMLLRLADNQVVASGATLPASVDGMAITIGGTPVAGDSFLIQPTRAGAANLALAIADPRSIAAAAPIRTSTALTNTGTASISAGEVLDVTNPNLQVTTTLNFVAGGYQVNGAGAVIPYTSGANIDLNGWRVAISGTPAAGDAFTIGANSNGVADNRNGVLLGALQTRNTMEGGTATYQSAYSTIVAQAGNKTREVKITGEAQQSLLDQAQSVRDQLSGVNLDEEAANLLRYQQAYQAAAKVISIASTLFDEILALGR
ncbi:MAG: flagellar hook-associated protein FlgK [Rhodocyclaceae bacterium]|nr:flagellar hook-associated protein FlgK [Rhodocyclaceae bacterium]